MSPRRLARAVAATAMATIAGLACVADQPQQSHGVLDTRPPELRLDAAAPAPATPRDGGTARPRDASAPRDAAAPVDACTNPVATLTRKCVPETADECDGTTDQRLAALGVPAARRNVSNDAGRGVAGNGFDDDCDGLVDEGCPCASAGVTKDCWLVPPSQATASGSAAGWCEPNAKGTVACAGSGTLRWSGLCRGATPPAARDACAAGDYDCNGVASDDGPPCSCAPAPVACPVAALATTPLADARALPVVDGAAWIRNPARRTSATGWTWTVVGGDCDNVLPQPSFALYPTAAGFGPRLGARQTVQYDAAAAKWIAASTGKTAGLRVVDGVTTRVFPAFTLSGEYVVQGEFDLDGRHYACTQRVEARAPGLRAELCWDANADLDLHVARLQGNACATPGWDTTCLTGGEAADCHFGAQAPRWGYAPSPPSACRGWSSRVVAGDCPNPRLDRDNTECDRAETDPTAHRFCAPENVNVDRPASGDRFAIGVRYYWGGVTVRPHVNVYCAGKRVLSTGLDPAAGPDDFPRLRVGGHAQGDFWMVATVWAVTDSAGELGSCAVEPVPSRAADVAREGQATTGGVGGGAWCVDAFGTGYTSRAFVERSFQTHVGGIPSSAADWCKH